jgi:outer membrane protein assembly factor BamB
LKQKKWGRRLVLFFFPGVLIFLVSCTGGLPAASWFGVSAGDDVAYLAANEQLFALNLESGAELWAFPAAPNREVGPFFSTPLVTADSVVVGGFGDGKLYAVARNGGSQDWSVETDAAIVDGPVTIDGEIVVGNNDGVVYRVDWETQSKELLLQADSAIWATPLVDRAAGRLYIASMDHHLYALDLTTGEQVWVFEAGGALVGTPAISDGKLYFGDLSSTFYVIDAGTAGELWRVDTQGWVWGGRACYPRFVER